MINQLIVSSKKFLTGKTFDNEAHLNEYIICYFDMSTMFFRNLNLFSFRTLDKSLPIVIGESTPELLLDLISNRCISTHFTHSNCDEDKFEFYNLDTNENRPTELAIKNITEYPENFICVIYNNYS